MDDAVITIGRNGLDIAFEWQAAFNALFKAFKTDARRGGRASFCLMGYLYYRV
jgi:hypothetical protein